MIYFGLLGDGYIAQFHKKAIEHVGGKLINIYDPIKYDTKDFIGNMEYMVICSPSNCHYGQVRQSLELGYKVITEKPMCLPWEPLIDDDRINVVMQLRWLPLPDKANLVKVKMVRDKAYFESWKGDPKKTGGAYFHLFIHYIDLANQLGADFEGKIVSEGKQERWIDDLDILSFDTQDLYNRMYEDIIKGDGIKPRELYYLYWQLNRNSDMNGYGENLIGKKLYIENKLK